MELQPTSVMNLDPSSGMGQYIQAQNSMQHFQLPIQQLQGQGQIQIPGQIGQGQFVLNQSQLLQQLGQGQQIQLGQGQAIQLPGQQAQALQLPLQQALQLQSQQNSAAAAAAAAASAQAQAVQIQGQNGQTFQIQNQNGQAIHLQGQGGQALQLQGQNGQPIQLQGQNGQPIQIQTPNGQTIQFQGPNGQPIQLQNPSSQQIQFQNQQGQAIQLQAQTAGAQGLQLQSANGQAIQIQGQQPTLQLQGQQLQVQGGHSQSLQLQNQLGQALQLQNQQLSSAVQIPGQPMQIMYLQGQPCQVVNVQGPNGQVLQQVVPLMLGADQMGNIVNPLQQQQMLLQAQSQQNQMVGQFVQTESGLVWQPTGVIGALDNSNNTATSLQYQQSATAVSQAQSIEAASQPEVTASNGGETVQSQDNHNESQQSSNLVNGDPVSSVPGSTNTTTTSSQPVGRIQIAAEDPEDSDGRPLYVNAKQYHRILKRRQARAKLESTGKVIRKQVSPRVATQTRVSANARHRR